MSTLDFLHGVEVIEIDDGVRPIQTARSSVIGLIGTAGKGPVNVPTLVTGNLREGIAKFGIYANDGFQIPQALDGIFDQVGAMCVVINVCDPAVHSSDIASEAVQLDRLNNGKTAKPYISDVSLGTSIKAKFFVESGNKITLPVGATGVTSVKNAAGTTTYALTTDYTVAANVITKAVGSTVFPAVGVEVEVTYTVAAPVVNVDYTITPDTGTITRIPGGKIAYRAIVSVSYTYVDPTQVDSSDIIGGVDELNNYIGVKAFLAAEAETGIIPRILIAPGWTHQKPDTNTANAVVAEMLGVADQIKAIIFADGPNTTDEDAVKYRADWGSARIMVVDPFNKVQGPDGNIREIPSSIHWAGITARVDNEIGFWASPSNKEISGVVGTARHVDFAMGNKNCRANYLNSLQVSCVIRKNGFRTWGNRSTSEDPKHAFLCVRRTADMIQESILAAHLWAVDRVITKNYLTEVVEGVNAYLRHLTAVGAIYGGKAWADRGLNTDEVIANGQVYIDFDFTAPYPAEHVTFRAHLVNDYIEEIFADAQAA